MTEFVNKCLLAGDKFMPWFHLRQPGFTYIICALFTKHCKRILKSTEASNLKHIYKNKLDKVCFAHDASYANSTYLGKRNISDKALKDKSFEIAGNPKYDGYPKGLESIVCNFFVEKTG